MSERTGRAAVAMDVEGFDAYTRYRVESNHPHDESSVSIIVESGEMSIALDLSKGEAERLAHQLQAAAHERGQ